MKSQRHTILCVDDEEYILSALRRVLRNDDYDIFTATSGNEGLKILEENEIHIVISDQRMPEMSGTDFLAYVMERYPDVVRMILSGYADVDSISESINKGHVYKLILKPWDDESLRLEIKRSLDYYELINSNRLLNTKIIEQNEKLNIYNEELENTVRIRTEELEIKNQVLELSRVILEGIPIPIIGVDAEKIIVFLNHKAESLLLSGRNIAVGNKFTDYFDSNLTQILDTSLKYRESQRVKKYPLGKEMYDIDFTPLPGKFTGRGIIIVIIEAKKHLKELSHCYGTVPPKLIAGF